MKGVAVFALLLVTVHLSHSCRKVNTVLVCSDILANFEPGCSAMLVTLKNVGEINSTLLQSENLASITEIESNNVGITRIADNAFSSFPNLQRLNLDDNKLSQINPNWLRNPAALRELKLEGNLLEDLKESSLDGLSNLTQLRLNKNRIQSIHLNGFSSQRTLADLDLSENRLTWVSPQVFMSLSSLRFIRLDGNPWNCSCDAKNFVVFLKELKDRNQLNRSLEVTCETPPPLKGRPVWNVSVCLTPPQETPSREPTSYTANSVTSHPLQPTSKMKTSHQTKPTDPSTAVSSLTATLSSSETPVGTKPTDAQTPPSTESYVTSPSSSKESYINSKPTNKPVTAPTKPETTSCSPPDSNNCTLPAVIAVLSVLLLVMCFMVVMQVRKCSSKTVMPVFPKDEEEEEEEKKNLEDGSRLSRDQSEGRSESRHPGVANRSLTGVRAKSANAVILTSPFCVSEKDEVLFQTETDPSEVSENLGEKKLVTESGAETGGVELDSFTTTDMVSENKRPDDESRNIGENSEGVHANTDVVPYLSIGTIQNKPSPDEEAPAGPASPLRRKMFRRISTWPPTAAQWQARCKMKEEEGEGFAVWKQTISVELSDNVVMIVNKMEHPTSSIQSEKEDETKRNQMGDHMNLKHTDALKPNESSISEQIPDPATSIKIRHEKINSAEHPAHESSIRSDIKKDLKQPVSSKTRAEKSVGSKAPSGGTSPDDETLLSGNEYVFMDLLHEVVQNHGRWTRERWKQVHVNKQRRSETQFKV